MRTHVPALCLALLICGRAFGAADVMAPAPASPADERLVFSADGEPLLILTSGAHRVDTAAVAAQLGVSSVRRADPEFVRWSTGQAIGGVAPVGHPQQIRTLVDRWLQQHDVVWAAAGHPHTVFPTSFAELVRITGGAPADVAGTAG